MEFKKEYVEHLLNILTKTEIKKYLKESDMQKIEFKILCMKYGIEYYREYSYKEIGNILKMNSLRVEQRCIVALNVLLKRKNDIGR